MYWRKYLPASRRKKLQAGVIPAFFLIILYFTSKICNQSIKYQKLLLN